MTTAFGLVSLAAALMAVSTPIWSHSDSWAFPQWLEFATGGAILAAGLIVARRRSGRPIGRLMLLASIVYFIPYVSNAASDLAWTIARLTWSWWFPIGAHIAISYPEGRLRSTGDRVLVLAGYVATIGLSLLMAFVEDPLQLGCERDCPRNLLLVHGDPDLYQVLNSTGNVAALLLALLVFGTLTRRLFVATRPERRVLAPVFWALIVNVAAYTAWIVAGLLAPSAEELAYNVLSAAVILIPTGLIVGLWRGVMARSAVGNLLVRIGEGKTPAELERDLVWALGDPSVRLAFKKRGQTRFVDASGAPVDVMETPARTVTIIDGANDAAVAVMHDPSLRRDQPELLDAVSAATRMAIENQRLQAEVKLVREMPSGLAERLLREGAQIGDTQTLLISVLMSDIRGYSTIAEHADVHALAAQLNEHRGAMNRVVSGHGGTVMQFVGDAVFAVFGAPLPLHDHALRAVQAAIEMQQAQMAINQTWSATRRPQFGLGIGVTTGQVAAALLGSAEHVEYSVVGDVVNLAQRIQNWAGRGDVVISDATYAELDGAIHAERLPAATVKGREVPVVAHRIAVRQSAQTPSEGPSLPQPIAVD
ncbi:MAG: adenylate/guanylate cyclase domain-containing protein [Chloroflexota bacterium]|nr:adenylate/guanylate cyclase domain-containing protein [Chloroflexota bacterium]